MAATGINMPNDAGKMNIIPSVPGLGEGFDSVTSVTGANASQGTLAGAADETGTGGTLFDHYTNSCISVNYEYRLLNLPSNSSTLETPRTQAPTPQLTRILETNSQQQ